MRNRLGAVLCFRFHDTGCQEAACGQRGMKGIRSFRLGRSAGGRPREHSIQQPSKMLKGISTCSIALSVSMAFPALAMPQPMTVSQLTSVLKCQYTRAILTIPLYG